jgi:N-methylhydantoinase B
LRLDRVTLEILHSYLNAVVETMGYVLGRTAHTTFVKETADFATGLVTPEGECYAYPRNLGVSNQIGLLMDKAIDQIDTYQPGDIIFFNDPYSTHGMVTHLPDLQMLKPVFDGDNLICFVWGFLHCSDVGGAVPASISPTFTEIFQEGFRLPPKKLYRSGVLNHDILDVFLANCRIPETNWGDLKALIAALNVGEERLHEVFQKFGVATLQQGMYDLLDYAASRARAVIRDIPDGTYRFVDYMEDDFVTDTPIRLAVAMTVAGDEVTLDLTGTDPQVGSAFNIPTGGRRHPFILKTLIDYVVTHDPGVPLNGGLIRPMSNILPEGSVVNPQFPAAVGVRNATSFLLYDAVLGCLAQAVPDKTRAPGCGEAAIVVASMFDPASGRRFLSVVEPMMGGGGARPTMDGIDGSDTTAGFLRNTPVESIEAELPILIRRYDLIPNSGGAGRYRGGLGIRLDFQVFHPDVIVTARGLERFKFNPWGVHGGRYASTGRAVVNPGTDAERDIGKIDVLRLGIGDVLSLSGPGGGGYGDPLERDPQAVLEDVQAGYLDPRSAAEDYGVLVVNGSADYAATAALRAAREPRLGRFDLGPGREAFERVWTPELVQALQTVLAEVPITSRPYVKQALAQRAKTASATGSYGVQQLLDDWRELKTQLGGIAR